MSELSMVIYYASICPYHSLYVFIVMAELLDIPIVNKTTPLI